MLKQLPPIYNVAINPTGIGGTESFSRLLMECFPELNTYCYGVPEHEFYKANYFYVKKRFLFKLLHWFFKKLFPESIRYDNTCFGDGIYVFNAPCDLSRVPESLLKNNSIIYVAHNTPEHVNSHKNYLGSNREERLRLMKYVDRVVCLSDDWIYDFSTMLGLPEDRIQSCFNSTNLVPVTSPKTNVSSSVVTICRLENKAKRLDRVLEVAHLLPSIEFKIFGNGPDRIDLVEKSKELSNVKFMGSTTDVPKVLNDTGLFLMTSDNEGFPVVLVEALSQAVPIIIGHHSFSSANDIVVNGINGFVVNEFNAQAVADKVNTVLKELPKYSKGALDQYQQFDKQAFKEQWQNVFQDVLPN